MYGKEKEKKPQVFPRACRSHAFCCILLFIFVPNEGSLRSYSRIYCNFIITLFVSLKRWQSLLPVLKTSLSKTDIKWFHSFSSHKAIRYAYYTRYCFRWFVISRWCAKNVFRLLAFLSFFSETFYKINSSVSLKQTESINF